MRARTLRGIEIHVLTLRATLIGKELLERIEILSRIYVITPHDWPVVPSWLVFWFEARCRASAGLTVEVTRKTHWHTIET